MKRTPATIARESKGYSVKVAAKKLGIGERTLRGFELRGGAPYQRARQISRLYGCSICFFM